MFKKLKNLRIKPKIEIEPESDKESQEVSAPEIPDGVLTLLLIGAGSRGRIYADYATTYPKRLKIVGVNDLSSYACEKIAEEHGIPADRVFVGDWTKVASVPKFADCVAICTPDRFHLGPAEAFANLKYNMILEKPMSVSLEECVRIVKAIEKNGIICAVSHVYRHSYAIRCIKKIIDSGILGEIMNIQLVEMIGFYHFAHSYVRGNWHKESTSSFSLLTKSCHDVDLVAYLMGQNCTKISSFGNLTYFKKENKPKEAGKAKLCLNCKMQNACPYSAKKIYIDRFLRGCDGWPVNVVHPKEPIDIESLTDALNNSNYGKCVYEMDNDVADNQVVNMFFENGTTASLTMVAFTKDLSKKARIFGTMGELNWTSGMVQVNDFRTGKNTNYNPVVEVSDGNFQCSGHGGGDFAFIDSFLKAVSTGDQSHILTGPEESLRTHSYVFAAEESRKSGLTVDVQNFRDGFM